MSGPSWLERENGIVLDLVQALLRLISSNVVAVGVKVVENEVKLYFWVNSIDSDIREDVDDVVFKFEALSDEWSRVSPLILEGGPDVSNLDPRVRMVYWAKGFLDGI